MVVHNDDRGLGIAEVLNVIGGGGGGGGVGGQADDLVGDPGMVQGQTGELGLRAAWLAVHGDVHGPRPTL